MASNGLKIAIVGGGLAGLAAAMKIAEQGHEVDLISVVPVKRSHSVCAQGGINGAVNTKGEGDSPLKHLDDTVYGGDFLANQPPVKRMCDMAPQIIYLFDRMGVPFSRTQEGLIDFRRFGGTLHHRTAFAGASTGQQLLYSLDEQVRKYEVAGKVNKYEGWEMLSLVLDDYQVCRGLIAMNLQTLELKAFNADAVIMATGGPGLIFGKSTNSMTCTGSAVSAAYQQGAKYANGEFIQVHPTSIPGEDKLRLMSESARGEGGRVWVPKNQGDARNAKDIPTEERWYFLEEKYPAYGNLVPRDIATREIFQVCLEGYGVGGENQVYLDLTHIPAETLTRKLGAILEIYEMFVGDDPRYVPMRIFPGVHYSMGGLWVDSEQRTNIPGLFAAGECDYSVHGANRLGANSLVSCVYGGFTAAPSAIEYAKNVERGSSETNGVHAAELKKQQEINDSIIKNEGAENQYKLHDELGKWMTDNVTVVRYNDRLKATDDKILELIERYQNISINDSNLWATQAVPHARQLWNMLQLARVITLGALNRDESRGAHYKPDFPDRNDEDFLKTTIAEYSMEAPILSYEAVDTGLVEPRKRDYSSGKAKAAAKQAEKSGLPVPDGAAQIPQPGSELKPEGREEIWVKEGEVAKGESFKDIVEEEKNKMSALPKKKKYTPEEYLALEEKAEYKSEYVNGYIFKMAGGTEAHIQISFNATRLFADKLRGKCRAYQSEMKVWVAEAGTFFYPDVTVVCGERKFHGNRTDTVENPILLIEVLSKSTEEYDKNDKFFTYQNIESFQEYVLISQSKPVVQQYIRQPDGDWKIKATIGLASKIYFESVDAELSLEEIYDLVEFEENNQ